MSKPKKYAVIIAFIFIAVLLCCRLAWNHSAFTKTVPAIKAGSEQDKATVDKNTPRDGIPILMYHKVNPHASSGGLGLRVNPSDFDWEMHYLKTNGYHTVDLGAVVDHFQKGKKLPAKPVVITFDDGYQDNYQYAYPILKKYHFTATIFLVANTIGGINEFDYKVHVQPRNKMLTWNEIHDMSRSGITFGSHTLDHVKLAQVSSKEAEMQISDSKTELEKELGKKVLYFCYPYGNYNQAVEKIVQECGYRAATTTRQGLAGSNLDPYLLNRIRITGHYNHQKFIDLLPKYNLNKF
jgi:peptidoglycan/xylan/chitin deacetylase (PgdA/CDA1 family)